MLGIKAPNEFCEGLKPLIFIVMKYFHPKVSLFILLLGAMLNTRASDEKDTTRIGIFLESIYDLDFANYNYATNFWMWSVVRGDVDGNGVIDGEDSLASLERINNIELSNAKIYDYSHQSSTRVESKGATYWWAAQFCRATIYEKWNLNNYPFDKQKVILKFESSAYDTSQVIMLNEQDSLTFKKDINIIGWEILRSKIRSRIVSYDTDFGDPNGNGKSSYSRVVYIIELQRLSTVAFFVKLCMGVFIAFLVAVIVFWISPSSMDSRFGLSIGALFAVTANKYVVDSTIPQTATNCLIDKVHEATFVYILLIIISCIIALKLHERNKHDHRHRFDRLAFGALLISYIIVIVTFMVMAQSKLEL